MEKPSGFNKEYAMSLPQGSAEWKRQMALYLKTPQWREKRRRVIERDKHRCQNWFGHTHDLEVHHRTYDHAFDEPLEDLITYCRRCHEAATSCIRDERYSKRRYAPKDVLRPTPNQERLESNVSPKLEAHDCRRVTPDPSQRPVGRPAK